MLYTTCTAAHAAAWSEATALRGVPHPIAYAWAPAAPAAVLGLSQKAERELCVERLQQDGIDIVRRSSGGGAVLLMDGVVCFGAIVPPAYLGEDNTIHGAFRRLTAPAVGALQALGVDASLAGISDLAAPTNDGLRKLAGTAQLRKRNAILVHGSLLLEADLSRLEAYLQFPSKVPDYRQDRSHTSFCRNVNDLLSAPASAASLVQTIAQKAGELGWCWTEIPETLAADAEYLYTAKYTTTAWTLHRKRPPARDMQEK